MEFSNFALGQIPDLTIQEWIKSHDLELDGIKQLFKKPVYRK
jgi:hypothetical protein